MKTLTSARLLGAAFVALGTSLVPVTSAADGAFGLELSEASCTDAGCGHPTYMDCMCPDIFFPDRRPWCSVE